MKIAYDLHIHSALSPCGDNDMTPNNIVNMSLLKGLRLIAITDHNAMSNVASAIEVGKMHDILVLPGIEVTTLEDIHVLCYFSDLNLGLEFGKLIYDGLPNINNDEELLGNQLIFDCNDKVIGKVRKLLINSTKYTIEELDNLVSKYNGALVPAHIDKSAYSIISSLGFIPNTLNIKTIEIHDEKKFSKMSNLIDENKYNILNNSDAHYLTDINEAISYMNLDTLSPESVIDYLNGWRNKQ